MLIPYFITVLMKFLNVSYDKCGGGKSKWTNKIVEIDISLKFH